MLNQTTYRLWLRNEPKLNQTLLSSAGIDAAIAALVTNIIPQTLTNPIDQQD
jgi:hypothetical protein